jgi:hypothetical protein
MLAQPQMFPCPNCKEIINDSMERCRYCNAPVDPQAAATAATRIDDERQRASHRPSAIRNTQSISGQRFPQNVDEISTCGKRLLMNFSDA